MSHDNNDLNGEDDKEVKIVSIDNLKDEIIAEELSSNELTPTMTIQVARKIGQELEIRCREELGLTEADLDKAEEIVARATGDALHDAGAAFEADVLHSLTALQECRPASHARLWKGLKKAVDDMRTLQSQVNEKRISLRSQKADAPLEDDSLTAVAMLQIEEPLEFQRVKEAIKRFVPWNEWQKLVSDRKSALEAEMECRERQAELVSTVTIISG